MAQFNSSAILKGNSQLLRVCLLGVLVLVLLIPVEMIRNLVAERQERNQSATAEISSKWGNAQTIIGPALVIPYSVRWTEESKTGPEIVRTGERMAIFLPKTLRATGRITTEERARGIFVVPVYRLKGSIEGEFGAPNLADLGIDPAAVSWDRAHLAVGIADVRGIQEQSTVSWNGVQHNFLPGSGGFSDGGPGIHTAVTAGPSDTSFKFSFPLTLNGSLAAYFAPFGEDTVVQMSSNFAAPNFQGNWLPSDRTVSASGFDATWRISYLGRNYPQAWTSGTDVRKAIEASRFGLEFSEPIDRYRLADRSLKYAALFILLTFATVWLVEVLSKARVHPIQYLMLGAALCTFYLLELSLSEHISFMIAYLIASLSIIIMLAGYSRIILATGRRSMVPAGVAALYAYLFVVLTNEDGALLVGAIGLFSVLAAIMFLTRGINWYAETTPSEPTLD
jgi:inner membrane protein